MDRAHRLGSRKFDQNIPNPRPRPVIVRMTMFKDKQYILRNSYKLADSPMNVSEDYSKATLELHKFLVKEAKLAKNTVDSLIKSFRITYRRVSLKFQKPTTNEEYFRSFSMKDIENNPHDWFKK